MILRKKSLDNISKIREMIGQKRFIEAEFLLSKNIENNPKSYHYFLRSQCNYNLELYFKALSDINEVLKAIPNDPAKYFLRYQILLALSYFDLAFADLERVTLLNPNHPGLCDAIEKLHSNSMNLIKICNSKLISEDTRKRICENSFLLFGTRFNVSNKSLSFKRLVIENVSEASFDTIQYCLDLFGRYESLTYENNTLEIKYESLYSAALTKIFFENIYGNHHRFMNPGENHDRFKCHLEKAKIIKQQQNTQAE